MYEGVDNITTTFYQIHNRMLVVTTVYFSFQFFGAQYKRSASKHPKLKALHRKVLQKCLNQNWKMQCTCLQWRLDFKDTAKLFSYYGSSYLSLCKRTIVKSLDTATATTVEILTTSSIRFELKKDRISWNADAFEDKLQTEPELQIIGTWSSQSPKPSGSEPTTKDW